MTLRDRIAIESIRLQAAQLPADAPAADIQRAAFLFADAIRETDEPRDVKRLRNALRLAGLPGVAGAFAARVVLRLS